MFREFESHSFRQLPVLTRLKQSLKFALSYVNAGVAALFLYQPISVKLASFDGIQYAYTVRNISDTVKG